MPRPLAKYLSWKKRKLQNDNFPAWLKKRLTVNQDLFETKEILLALKVNTVCESSLCPNLNECFSRRFATFLILGNACTRSCGFCSVSKDAPKAVDPDEPARISEAVKRLGLKYAVITSVTRDDLADGGAGQFVKVVEQIKNFSSSIKIEVLIPDFKGEGYLAERVVRAGPDIVGHNIETVKRLYPNVRPGADYKRSLALLRIIRSWDAGKIIKSGIMLGLGETEDEVIGALDDIRSTGCDIVTIGQYLRPGQENLPVKRFVAPQEFMRYKYIGEEIGFKYVASGPFVRSSYFADRYCAAVGPDIKDHSYKPKESPHDRCDIAASGSGR